MAVVAQRAVPINFAMPVSTRMSHSTHINVSICVHCGPVRVRVALLDCTLLTGSNAPHYIVQRHVSFKGDQDSHLDGIIVASQKKHIDDSALKDRTLVPFFDSPVEASVLQPLQGRSAHKKPYHDNAPVQKQRKGTGKPATGTMQVVEDASNGIGKQGKNKAKKSSSPRQMSPEASPNASRKHHRDPSYRSLPGLATNAHIAQSVSGRQSPPRKRQEHTHDSATSMGPMPPAPAALKFAGPAFTNSPKPDALPIPTTSLLRMHEAADRLAAGLML